jgi:hypothetical protein
MSMELRMAPEAGLDDVRPFPELTVELSRFGSLRELAL